MGSFSFNAIRFALGALSLLPVLLAQTLARGKEGAAPASGAAGIAAGPSSPGTAPRASPGKLLAAGSLCGAVLFSGASLQQAGMIWTSAGKAAFLTGLYIILVPFAGLLMGKKQGWGLALGAALALVGLYLLSVTGGFSVSLGDGLEIVGALFWTAHIILLGKFTHEVDALALALVQNVVCAALSLVVAVFAEGFRLTTVVTAFGPGAGGALLPILYSGICSIGIAYTLQIVGQKGIAAGPAALILSLESVFAAVGGALILHETMSARAMAGAGLMLAGMIAAQVVPPEGFSRLKAR